jgi:chorismate mutase
LKEIVALRKKIDEIDERILLLLKERAEVSRKIGSTKKKNGLPIRDRTRENRLYAHLRFKAERLGLSTDLVETLYREIIAMCIRVQENSVETKDHV